MVIKIIPQCFTFSGHSFRLVTLRHHFINQSQFLTLPTWLKHSTTVLATTTLSCAQTRTRLVRMRMLLRAASPLHRVLGVHFLSIVIFILQKNTLNSMHSYTLQRPCAFDPARRVSGSSGMQGGDRPLGPNATVY